MKRARDDDDATARLLAEAEAARAASGGAEDAELVVDANWLKQKILSQSGGSP